MPGSFLSRRGIERSGWKGLGGEGYRVRQIPSIRCRRGGGWARRYSLACGMGVPGVGGRRVGAVAARESLETIHKHQHWRWEVYLWLRAQIPVPEGFEFVLFLLVARLSVLLSPPYHPKRGVVVYEHQRDSAAAPVPPLNRTTRLTCSVVLNVRAPARTLGLLPQVADTAL